MKEMKFKDIDADLVKEIKRMAEDEMEEIDRHRYKKPKEIHISELSLCPLELKRIIKEAETNDIELEDFTFDEVKYLYVGRMFHKEIEELLRNRHQLNEVIIESKIRIPLKNGFSIIGTPDIVVNNIPYDLKTCSSIALTKENLSLKYMQQLTIYCNLLGSKRGYFVLIEKNSMNMEQVLIEIGDNNLLAPLIETMNNIIEGKEIYHDKEKCICQTK